MSLFPYTSSVVENYFVIFKVVLYVNHRASCADLYCIKTFLLNSARPRLYYAWIQDVPFFSDCALRKT
jgi:hypothetical protein